MEQNNNQNEQQNQTQKVNNPNRAQMDHPKPKAPDRRPPSQDRNFNQDRNRPERSPQGDRNQWNHNDRAKPQPDQALSQKNREQRSPDRNKTDNVQPPRNQQTQPGGQTQSGTPAQPLNSNPNNRNNYAKNPVKSAPHPDTLGRNIKPKRVETVEDIQADIERIDKDIQFEIKQIRAVKLGL